MIYDGILGSATQRGEGERTFEVRRSGVTPSSWQSRALMPHRHPRRSNPSRNGRPATFVVSGYEVRGAMHMVAEADPVMTPIVASRHFTPVTDAVITCASDGSSFHEEIVIVNLACAAVLRAAHRRLDVVRQLRAELAAPALHAAEPRPPELLAVLKPLAPAD